MHVGTEPQKLRDKLGPSAASGSECSVYRAPRRRERQFGEISFCFTDDRVRTVKWSDMATS